jgi:hypothetical protein
MTTEEFGQLILKLDDVRVFHQEQAKKSFTQPNTTWNDFPMWDFHNWAASTIRTATDQLIHEFGRAGA